MHEQLVNCCDVSGSLREEELVADHFWGIKVK